MSNRCQVFLTSRGPEAKELHALLPRVSRTSTRPCWELCHLSRAALSAVFFLVGYVPKPWILIYVNYMSISSDPYKIPPKILFFGILNPSHIRTLEHLPAPWSHWLSRPWPGCSLGTKVVGRDQFAAHPFPALTDLIFVKVGTYILDGKDMYRSRKD